MFDLVLPFYVVCDQSFTMTDHVVALDEELWRLYYAVATDPLAAGRIRLCVIGFSATAEVLLPLTKLDATVHFRRQPPGAAARFGAAFSLLRSTIERDVMALRADWHWVSRPAVFFLTDGQPTDPGSWPAAYSSLADPAWPDRPEIVAFGIKGADPSIISRIATMNAFLETTRTTPAAAVQAFAGALTSSILDSCAVAAESGCASVGVPRRVSGYVSLRR